MIKTTSDIEFELGGKLRGFKMGVGFFGDILRHFDVSIGQFADIIEKNAFIGIPVILFHAHKQDCKRKGFSADFTIEDVTEWIEEIPDSINNENIEKLIRLMTANLQGLLGINKDE